MRLAPYVPAVVIGAISALIGLGSSSLFVDEVYSWRAASVGVGELLHRVRVDEVASPAYYLVAHEWIGRFDIQGEAALRLPSALAAIALVCAVAWVGTRVGGRWVGALAALLTAVSPLVLMYGQQLRAYVFAALLVTVATGAALEGWLVVAALAAVGAFWLHYTAALVVAPLVVWMARRSWVWSAAVVAGCAVWVPLMADQLGRGHEAGTRVTGAFTAEHLARTLAAPFDGRVERMTPWVAIGVALTVAALVVVARRRQYLLLALAATGPAATVLLTLADKHVLLSRYVVVAAPFLLVAIAYAALQLPVRYAAAGAVAAFVALLAGTVLSHQQRGMYPDVRGAVTALAREARPGDLVVLDGYPAIGPAVEYDLKRRMRVPVEYSVSRDPAVLVGAARRHRRIWLLTSQVSSPAALRHGFGALRYRTASARTFPASSDLQLVLAVPP